MRTLKDNQGLTPIEVNANFPDGAIIDETSSVEGTAVVREIYNDILVNLYKIARASGIISNNVEDNESNGYQLFAAFQKLVNVQNDIEQTLSLLSTTFSIGLDITLLPSKYFIFAQAAADYVTGMTYTFKGTTGLTYPFSSITGFNDGDELLLILNHGGVIAYNLSGVSPEVSAEVQFPVFGSPLAYSDSDKLWYQSEGLLYSDLPEVYDLQGKIRTSTSDATILVYEMLCIGSYILCLTYSGSTNLYQLYSFTTSNFNTSPMAIGATMGSGTDYQPFAFYDGTLLYLTNASGSSPVDGAIGAYTIDFVGGTITNAFSTTLTDYKKSTNSIIINNYLYAFISGVIYQWNLSTGTSVVGPSFPGTIGLIFLYKGNVYYSSESVAKKWSLPIYS